MDSLSPISVQKASPKPQNFRKSFVTSLMEVATLRTPSFKEDTYSISNLKPSERKALQELKLKLQTDSSESSSMWGVSLLGCDEKGDVILLKFLRARDFKVSDSLHMLEKCLSWRKDFGSDNILEEDLGFKELEGVVAYMHGYDREGHPVCYNAYGVFKDKEMYERIFGDEEKLKKFMRWRVQVLERGIDMLHFKPGGINSIIQVTDLKDMPKRELRVASNQILSLFQDNYPEMVARKLSRISRDHPRISMFKSRFQMASLERGIDMLHFKPGGINSIIQVTDLKDMPKRELRVASNQILSLFQDNYPEMVARKIFVNVPWYFSVLYSMFSPFLTQRTKSKFVISKEGNVAETLYKFIRPEDIPVQYGGLSRPTDLQNGPPKPATEFTVKGGEKVNIQVEGIEAGATITWDIVVGGWELEYSAEFVSNGEGSYTIAVEKPRKIAANEEAIHNSFTSKEAGKMVLSVDNTASRKRKVAAYRYIVSKSATISA